jgi:uncharacterized protein YjiS (DUF1127 family)
MSCYLQDEAAAAFPERRSASWHMLFTHTVDRMRAVLDRRRQRQELLDYLASDPRAAADLGISSCEARNLSRRPFWRA